MITKADASEMAPIYHRYLNQIPDIDILVLLTNQVEEIKQLFTNLSSDKTEYYYAPGKWTLKELFGHMIDVERIMAYRALCIARGETTSLPGFDENTYVDNARFNEREWPNFLQEYFLLRQSNITLFKSFTSDMLDRVGNANNSPVTVRGLITIIAAHEFHHLQIIKDRYLS